MCPLCITAGTLYLASAGAGSAGGLAAVAAKVMRGRKGRKGRPAADPDPHAALLVPHNHTSPAQPCGPA